MDSKQVQTVLEELNYNWDNFTVNDFIQHLSRVRQRPISLMGAYIDVSGLCIINSKKDYIFYDLQRHRSIQLHAILHEAAHLIMKHRTFVLTADNLTQLNEILLHVNMRSRGVYHDPLVNREEDEAEYFAFLSQRAIAEGQRRKSASISDVSDDIFIPPFTGHSSISP